MTLSAAQRGSFCGYSLSRLSPGSARQLRGGSAYNRLYVAIGVAMYAFLLLDNLQSAGAVCAPFAAYSNLLLDYETILLTSPCCSASGLRRLIRLQTTSWLIIYLDRDVYAPNAVLHALFLARLAPSSTMA